MKTQAVLSFVLYAALSFGKSPLNFSVTQKKFNGSETTLQNKTQLAFTENKGQVRDQQGNGARDIKFIAKGKELDIFLLQKGISYQFKKISGSTSSSFDFEKNTLEKADTRIETFRMDLVLKNSNPGALITKEEQSADYTNYYNFDALEVRSFGKVIYHEIYPKIDWIVYSFKGQLKYDFVVRPGGDPSMIKLEIFYSENLDLNKDGSVQLGTRLGTIKESAPVSFQNDKKIKTNFVLDKNILSFHMENYDVAKDLIIDPTVTWATYYGAADLDLGAACATDASGNVYLAGHTRSSSNIASGGYQNTFVGVPQDAFLVKFNSSGQRVWATYYGGTDNEYYSTCAVDGNGDVYLAGTTSSTAGISSSGHQNTFGGDQDGFLVKFTSSGQRLWATYYGGAFTEFGFSCTTDNANNVYLCGRTTSPSGIAANGYLNSYSNLGAFLVMFNSNGVRKWGTYYPAGGALTEAGGLSCIADNSGNIYMSGAAISTTGVASGGHQTTIGGGKDAMLVKFDTTGARIWATYYGGSGDDIGTSCAVDNSGNVYLGGYTTSTTNISSSGHQSSLDDDYDGFLVKFNSSGVRQWGTYYGGSNFDQAKAVVVDPSGNVYLAGTTASTNNIAFSGIQNTQPAGPYVGFISKFNSNGVRSWGTYYSGHSGSYTGSEEYNIHSNSCASDLNGNIYWAGSVQSYTDIALGGFQTTAAGDYDAFLVKFSCDFSGTITAAPSPSSICFNNTATLTASGANSYSWSSGGSAASTTVNPQSTTVYTVTAMNEQGCVTRQAVTVDVELCTGITENKINTASLLVYPNPTNNELFIETQTDGDLSIYNALGQLVYQQKLSAGKNKVNLSNEKNGVYFLKVNSTGSSTTQKIIKEDVGL